MGHENERKVLIVKSNYPKTIWTRSRVHDSRNWCKSYLYLLKHLELIFWDNNSINQLSTQIQHEQ